MPAPPPAAATSPAAVAASPTRGRAAPEAATECTFACLAVRSRRRQRPVGAVTGIPPPQRLRAEGGDVGDHDLQPRTVREGRVHERRGQVNRPRRLEHALDEVAHLVGGQVGGQMVLVRSTSLSRHGVWFSTARRSCCVPRRERRPRAAITSSGGPDATRPTRHGWLARPRRAWPRTPAGALKVGHAAPTGSHAPFRTGRTAVAVRSRSAQRPAAAPSAPRRGKCATRGR